MSSSVKGREIQLTRGDTLQVLVTITKDGEEYTPQDGDSVRFALKHEKLNAKRTDYKDEEPLIIKDIPIDTMILELEPEDTKDLDFGTYVYDIEITFEDGVVDTFIPAARLNLTEEVH